MRPSCRSTRSTTSTTPSITPSESGMLPPLYSMHHAASFRRAPRHAQHTTPTTLLDHTPRPPRRAARPPPRPDPPRPDPPPPTASAPRVPLPTPAPRPRPACSPARGVGRTMPPPRMCPRNLITAPLAPPTSIDLVEVPLDDAEDAAPPPPPPPPKPLRYRPPPTPPTSPSKGSGVRNLALSGGYSPFPKLDRRHNVRVCTGCRQKITRDIYQCDTCGSVACLMCTANRCKACDGTVAHCAMDDCNRICLQDRMAYCLGCKSRSPLPPPLPLPALAPSVPRSRARPPPPARPRVPAHPPLTLARFAAAICLPCIGKGWCPGCSESRA